MQAGKESLPPKKTRIKVACDACNRKRTKCDGQTPCSECIKNHIACTISRKVGKRGPKPGYLEALETRIRILESILTPEQWEMVGKLDGLGEREGSEGLSTGFPPEKKPRIHEQASSSKVGPSRQIPPPQGYDDLLRSSTPSHFPSDPSNAPSSSNTFQSAQHLGFGDLYTSSTPPTLSMGRTGSSDYLHPSDHQEYHAPSSASASASGRDSTFDLFPSQTQRRTITSSSYESMMMHSPLIMNQEEQHSPDPLGRASAPNLPSTSNAFRFDLVSCYFTNVHHKVPFLHEQSFMHELSTQKKSLLLAVYALGSVYLPLANPPKKDQFSQGDKFYQSALQALEQEPDGTEDYRTVAALFLLFKYAKGSGRIAEGVNLYMRAFRKIMALKLNLDLFFHPGVSRAVPLPESIRESRRRVFWSFFEYDVYVAFVLGKPPLLSIEQVHCQFPMDDEAWNMVCSLEKKYGEQHFVRDLVSEPPPKPSPFTSPIIESNDSNFSSSAHVPMLKLVNLFRRICHFNLEKAKGNALPAGEFNQIESALSSWYKSFETWLATVQLFSGSGLPAQSVPPWMTAFIQTLYHFCIICLHRNKLLSEVSPKSNRVSAHPSFEACHSSASSVSTIVLQMHNTTSDFKFAPSFTHTILFHLGLTYAMFATLLPFSQSRQTYLQHMDIFITALDCLSVYFSPTRNKLDVLRQLRSNLLAPRADGNYEVELSLFKKACTTGYPSLPAFVPNNVLNEYTKGRQQYHN